DPGGKELSLRDLGPSAPVAIASMAPMVGSPAPGFSYQDTDGRTIRLSDYRGRFVLIYFWASQCHTCRNQTEQLRKLYDRHRPEGIEILGVSYDTDRRVMERFRRQHGQTWPTSFSGHQLWEDPIGRLYRERGEGVLYLVGPSGLLEGTYSNIDELESHLTALMASNAKRPPS